MEEKRSWRQKNRKWLGYIFLTVLGLFVVMIVVRALLINGTGFDATTTKTVSQATTTSGTTLTTTNLYQPGKTLWDWMQLLIIPFVIAVAGYAINLTISRGEQAATEQRAKSEREIAEDNQREAALQAYIDKMSELLQHGKLRESQPEDEVRTIARVRTLTVLHRLDKERKNSVLQFLFESGLISKNDSLVKLLGANFSSIDLFQYHIHNADLSGAVLIEANLGGAFLQGTNLQSANLTRANFSVSKLNMTKFSNSIVSPSTVSLLNSMMGIDFMFGMLAGMAQIWREDYLQGINLSHAILKEADLSGTYLTQVDFHDSYLVKANLQYAELIQANLSDAKLIETNLQHAKLIEVNLQGTKLIEANLQGANLSRTNLQEAVLYGANLQEADLTNANLIDTDLSFANLEKAIVTPEQLKQAKSLQGATMPDGKKLP